MSPPAASHVAIDRERSRERIARDVLTLTGSQYTRSATAVCRYAYTPEWKRAHEYFAAQLRDIGCQVWEDPVGNLVAQNVPRGERAYGLGSHCDSNRNGGPWDGPLGVALAVEVARLNREHGLDLPLRVISFLEEEGSGFGQLLLGSRIAAGRIGEAELREVRAIDDGRPFFELAAEAGHDPERFRESAATLDDLDGWIETHIEQGRVLQDERVTLGVVEAISGYVHADLYLEGRSGHAGGTPMQGRSDALAAAAEVVLEAERLAADAGHGTVATVGELDVEPGLINVIPGAVRLSLDVRGVDDEAFAGVATAIEAFAQDVARRRGVTARYVVRQAVPATPMDAPIVGALEASADAAGVTHRRMSSGAAHDTMCVAVRSPVAMLFVPCRDGISHAPEEDADPADGARASEVVLNALVRLHHRRER
ncbi:Zn-dependent hydrolase [Capillimicrobium parvum]|uniref:N-carbamoyl-L-amino acid hydrolase n=1 Tax=Capillimicrobium parvum TaxID=2884022 RepID=A0A9E6XZ86_9ACTN|nr:Zn-dependent hydrolase [Capillimicrobium parvum]UGS37209.1 N-carbamoyl-L-amino acid hydrolase [Capillimicrobium parvum]